MRFESFYPLEKTSCQQHDSVSWNNVHIYFLYWERCNANRVAPRIRVHIWFHSDRNINENNKLYNIYMNKFFIIKLHWIANVHFVVRCSFVVVSEPEREKKCVTFPKNTGKKQKKYTPLLIPSRDMLQYDENNKKHSIFNLLACSISRWRNARSLFLCMADTFESQATWISLNVESIWSNFFFVIWTKKKCHSSFVCAPNLMLKS